MSTAGGKVVLGGARPVLPAPFDQGAFLCPTIITGLSPTSRCATEEVFGPFVTVHTFKTAQEALALANASEYGLAGSLWTSNLSRAHTLVKQWETGMVWVNWYRCPLHKSAREGPVKAFLNDPL
jgi:acyl-CoA reductase-like NAD-dependent aldehyde dehydrogenase